MAHTQAESDVDATTPGLKRVMGPGLLLLFIVGDILGAGVYAVTGQMATEVGGIVWVPFLVAFAFSPSFPPFAAAAGEGPPFWVEEIQKPAFSSRSLVL